MLIAKLGDADGSSPALPLVASQGPKTGLIGAAVGTLEGTDDSTGATVRTGMSAQVRPAAGFSGQSAAMHKP